VFWERFQSTFFLSKEPISRPPFDPTDESKITTNYIKGTFHPTKKKFDLNYRGD